MMYLPIITDPTVKNGGAHPDSSKNGNKTLPNAAPSLPHIMVRETAIVLKIKIISEI